MQALFLSLAMYSPIAGSFRCVLWMVVWRLLMGDPIRMAADTDRWNERTGREVWKDEFLTVH